MRYMRWSYMDMVTCPVDYLAVIGELAEMEAAKARARQHGIE